MTIRRVLVYAGDTTMTANQPEEVKVQLFVLTGRQVLQNGAVRTDGALRFEE